VNSRSRSLPSNLYRTDEVSAVLPGFSFHKDGNPHDPKRYEADRHLTSPLHQAAAQLGQAKSLSTEPSSAPGSGMMARTPTMPRKMPPRLRSHGSTPEPRRLRPAAADGRRPGGPARHGKFFHVLRPSPTPPSRATSLFTLSDCPTFHSPGAHSDALLDIAWLGGT
jgi:hypothetical protein